MSKQRRLTTIISDLEKQNESLKNETEELKKNMAELKSYPNKKELNKAISDYINSDTIEESIKKMMDDDKLGAQKPTVTNVSTVLQQI